ncbi:hypothetical protein H8356DRAFT_1071864 [Neocallimastix lanati (nom. inval.)]|nr:hypothetical protein H8356DRAFT_1071864 [Neocallimastix sp. JGI-2020a]
MCIYDGYIYALKIETTCHSKLDSGDHAINVETGTEITLGTDFVDTNDAKNLIMYLCNAKGCKQTIGYDKMKVRGDLTTGPDDCGYINTKNSGSIAENDDACNSRSIGLLNDNGGVMFSDKAKLHIYECSSGECVSTTGYIRSSNVNYEIKLDAVSAPNTDVTDCNTLGKMKSDGTFCNVGTEVACTLSTDINFINGAKQFAFGVDISESIIEEMGNFTNLALYFRKDSKDCTQTYGYLKTKDITSDYYSIDKGDSSKSDISEIESGSCTDGHLGILYRSNKYLCIHHTEASTISFSETTKKYEYKSEAAANAFTGADLIVEVSANTIVTYPRFIEDLSNGVYLIEVTLLKK